MINKSKKKIKIKQHNTKIAKKDMTKIKQNKQLIIASVAIWFLT